MNKVKRLFLDIETSPNVGIFWSAGHKQNISPESIIKERSIICICYKWGGEDKVHSLTWDSKQNDKKMLETIVKELNKADEIVGHNIDKFDMPWIRTRCLYHGIDMFPQYLTIDTLKYSRSRFYFNSNKLDYIGKFLNLGEKKSTSYNMWKEILLDNNRKTLQDMVIYCEGDVRLLEDIYQPLSHYIPHKTHQGVQEGKDKYTCPSCGNNMSISKKRTTSSGVSKTQLKCSNKACGKYHTVVTASYEKSLLDKVKTND